MLSREDLIQQQSALLKQWSDQLAKMQGEMQGAGEAAQKQMQAQLAALEQQRAAAEAQLAKLKTAGEAAFADMQQGYQRMAEEYGAAVTRAWSRFQR